MKLHHRWLFRTVFMAVFFYACFPAQAQWQVPDHSVPVGRGSGTGFKSVGPCNAGVPIVGAGASADPICSGGGAFTGFANPSASVGLTAVNGSATTAMRSDGAPALSQSIAPTWSGQHTFSLSPIVPTPTALDSSTKAASTAFSSNAANLTSGTMPAARLPNGLNNFVVSGPTTSRTYTVPDANSTLAVTVASGTAALGTSAISSAACATVVTVSATGTATTDVIAASFNGDPTAVTGYIPSTSGGLSIFPYPTANNVNFKVCNFTSSSITPGAITLNWRVTR